MSAARYPNNISNDNSASMGFSGTRQLNNIIGFNIFDSEPLVGEKMAEVGRDQINDMIAASEARNDTKFERLAGDMREAAARQDAKFDLLLQNVNVTNSRLSEVRGDVKDDGRSTRANFWAGIAILAGVIIGVASLMAAVAPAAFTAGTYVKDSVKSEIKDQQQATEAAMQKSIDAAIQKAFKDARAVNQTTAAPPTNTK